jgi:hypothetical protein
MIKKDDPKTSYNSVYMPLLRNGTYTRNVGGHAKKRHSKQLTTT